MADNKNDQIEKINKELEDIDKALETEEKKINAIIKYFNWLEEKEKEEFNDYDNKQIERKAYRKTIEEEPKESEYKDKEKYEDDLKKYKFFRENPDIENYYEKRGKVAQNCLNGFNKKIVREVFKEAQKIGLDQNEPTEKWTTGWYLREYFRCRLTNKKYCLLPINVSFGVDKEGAYTILDIEEDDASKVDFREFHRYIKKLKDLEPDKCQNLMLKFELKGKDNADAIKFMECLGLKGGDDQLNVSKLKINENDKIPEGIKIILKKPIAFNENKTDSEYIEEIVDGIKTLEEFYYKTGLVNLDFKNKIELPDDFESLGRNIILYGPPGTGKTYNSAKLALWMCYKGEIPDNVEINNYIKVMIAYKELMEEGRIKFVTFHQSYGYEEFIEGIRPDVNKDEKTPSDAKGDISYKLVDGSFKAFCQKAREHKDMPCVFIIDEINRGNISKIFGELITLIEDSKREGQTEAVSAVLPYSGEQFSVPKNVYILGTMNTADRSIAMLDTALRRRFDFIEMLPDLEVLSGIKVESDDGKTEIDIFKMLDAINERIEIVYDREHTIGHAFFTGLKEKPSMEKLASVFRNKVIPLLQEYFYDDYEKINYVLGGNEKTVCGFLSRADKKDPFQSENRKIYSINSRSAFTEAKNYTAIYGETKNDTKAAAAEESENPGGVDDTGSTEG